MCHRACRPTMYWELTQPVFYSLYLSLVFWITKKHTTPLLREWAREIVNELTLNIEKTYFPKGQLFCLWLCCSILSGWLCQKRAFVLVVLFVTFLSNSNIWLILFFFLRATCHLSHGCTTSRIHSVGDLRRMKTGNLFSLNTLKKCSLKPASSVPITITVSIISPPFHLFYFWTFE